MRTTLNPRKKMIQIILKNVADDTIELGEAYDMIDVTSDFIQDMIDDYLEENELTIEDIEDYEIYKIEKIGTITAEIKPKVSLFDEDKDLDDEEEDDEDEENYKD